MRKRRLLVVAMTLATVVFVPGASALAAVVLPTSTDVCPAPLVGENVVTGATLGSDLLVGTAGPDLICGLDGGDIIMGKGGNDRLFGGPGNDSLIDGGRGNDYIDGGTGNDGNGSDGSGTT